MEFPHDTVGFALALYGSPRVNALSETLKEVGLQKHVKIRLSDRNIEDGMRGCFEAHVAAIKAGLTATPAKCSADNKEKQARFIFICEDDVFFRERCGMTVEKAFQTARRALLTETTDVVGIGGWCIRSMDDEVVPSCRKVKWNCAHAYMVSRKSAEKISQWTYVPPKTESAYGVGSHWDQVLSNSLRQSLIVPTVAFQKNSGFGSEVVVVFAGLRCSDACCQVTTTNTKSAVYYNMQRLRNIASPFLTQLFLETLFWAVPWFK